MKTKAQKDSNYRPPGSLEPALDKLESTYVGLQIRSIYNRKISFRHF